MVGRCGVHRTSPVIEAPECVIGHANVRPAQGNALMHIGKTGGKQVKRRATAVRADLARAA
jgi:hypothetical protein